MHKLAGSILLPTAELWSQGVAYLLPEQDSGVSASAAGILEDL